MSSAILEVTPDPKPLSNKPKPKRPKISLANEPSNTPGNLEPVRPDATPIKSTEEIRVFWIWSIFNLIFVPFGIGCCYFSHKVSQYKLQNRYEKANKWSRRTFVLNIMTTLLMIGVIITVVMLRYDFSQLHTTDAVNATRTTGGYIPWQPGR